MQPGERFSLIRAVHSTFMGEFEWTIGLTDAVLTQFGAAPSETESFTDRVLERLASLDDEALIQLNEHVNPGTMTTAPLTTRPVEEGPWAEGTFRLFLSHTHHHREAAGAVADWLGRWGVEAFVAHDTIEPTREWQDVIESALTTCDAFAALLTDGFRESNWCDQEVGFAVGRAILVVPVRITLDPYGFVGRVQAVTPHGASADARRYDTASQVFSAMARHPLTRARMVDPVLERFAMSHSFDAARAAWPDVVSLPADAWTPTRLARIRQAAIDNSQIQLGVPAEETGGRHFPEVFQEHLRRLDVD